ncbi:MAG: sigma 54-interacting transcriptional regulator [Nitrospirota bacterium]|nr:sigma 54-interacting transcriptional regulator [Nitrospirota bacterium]MDH5768863.1 sigma 54-interacting transcriptional regulator [Nitrospirota bacterium]
MVNIQMTYSLERENRILSALLEVSKVLNSSFDLEKNLSRTMSVLGDFLEMERGSVFLLDHKTKELRIVAAHGLTKEQIARGKYRIGEGIVGRVLEKSSPMVIPNVEEEPLFLNKTGSRMKRDGISFLCVPIAFKGESIGALSADRIFKDRTITVDEDIRVLEIVASIIAQYAILWKHYKESEQEKENLKLELKGRYSLPNIVGSSDRMQEVFEAVHRVADSKATVILYGESGTGKELIAKAIHYMSPRAKGPFIKFNCAAIPEGLLESELFGHEKGAFTGAIIARKGKFELASGGTILLDEIGDLPINLQPKILRILQEKEFERVGGEKTIKVDVRLIAATSRNLEELVAMSKFREDLYYRLNVVPIFLPALRERKEDVPILIEHFLRQFNKENKKGISLSSDALKVLVNYNWPGNVRELENAIERLVIMTNNETITSSDLPINFALVAPKGVFYNGSLKAGVEDMEKSTIINALKQSGWVQTKAARILGITSRQIGYKMKKYGISVLNS